MRRFLGTWALLSPAYLVAAALSSWLLLKLVDVTWEAFAGWLLVPVAQALVLSTASRKAPLFPPGRPPFLALVPVALALGVVAAPIRQPLHVGPGSLAHAFALLAGAAFLASFARSRKGRAPVAALGVFLLLLGLDAVRPYLASLPAAVLPRRGLLLGGLVAWGGLLALLFVTALAGQRALAATRPWAARLLGASLAVLFGAIHGALLQLFLHPWLEGAWAFAVPAAVAVAASLATASGLAALAGPRESS